MSCIVIDKLRGRIFRKLLESISHYEDPEVI